MNQVDSESQAVMDLAAKHLREFMAALGASGRSIPVTNAAAVMMGVCADIMAGTDKEATRDYLRDLRTAFTAKSPIEANAARVRGHRAVIRLADAEMQLLDRLNANRNKSG